MPHLLNFFISELPISEAYQFRLGLNQQHEREFRVVNKNFQFSAKHAIRSQTCLPSIHYPLHTTSVNSRGLSWRLIQRLAAAGTYAVFCCECIILAGFGNWLQSSLSFLVDFCHSVLSFLSAYTPLGNKFILSVYLFCVFRVFCYL